MAAADVSGLLEVASVQDSASATAEPAVNETTVAEATPEVAEGGEGAPETAPTDKVDNRTNPDAIRKALKAWRDTSPESAEIARKLNYIVGHEQGYVKEFPTVQEARQAKFILNSVGGPEGIAQLQSTIKSINETDQLLYNGDPKVLDNILEDMKREGKLDAFGKLASPFLDKLKATDQKVYVSTLRPHLHAQLVEANLPSVISAMEEALYMKGEDGKPAPDLKTIAAAIAEQRKWFNWLDQEVKAAGKKDPELESRREAFEKERSDFQSQQTKAFQNEVNTDWNRINNVELGTALKPYLKLPFAKNWTDATKKSVANEIMSTFLADLKADKAYQSRMDSLWSEAKPDKAKIIELHEGKTKLIASRVVKDVLDARYPGFSSVKGAPVTKTPVAKAAAPAGPVKPVFQTTMPKNEDVDWDKTSDVLFTTGRFFDRRGAFRTWNQKYK